MGTAVPNKRAEGVLRGCVQQLFYKTRTFAVSTAGEAGFVPIFRAQARVLTQGGARQGDPHGAPVTFAEVARRAGGSRRCPQQGFPPGMGRPRGGLGEGTRDLHSQPPQGRRRRRSANSPRQQTQRHLPDARRAPAPLPHAPKPRPLALSPLPSHPPCCPSGPRPVPQATPPSHAPPAVVSLGSKPSSQHGGGRPGVQRDNPFLSSFSGN